MDRTYNNVQVVLISMKISLIYAYIDIQSLQSEILKFPMCSFCIYFDNCAMSDDIIPSLRNSGDCIVV